MGRDAGAPPADVVLRDGRQGALSAREPPSRSAGRGLQGLLRLRELGGGVVCTDDPAGSEGMGCAGDTEDGVAQGLSPHTGRALWRRRAGTACRRAERSANFLPFPAARET